MVAGLGLAPGDAQPSTAAPGSDENRGTDELPGDGGRRGPRPRAEDAGVAAAARRRAGDAPGADGRDPQIWRGGDAEAFRDRWDSQVAPAWRDALDLLQRTAQSAEEHAAEQDVAPEPDSGAPDGGASGGDGAGGMGDIGFTSDEGAGDVPMDQDIQDAWQQMSAEDRRAVLQEMVDQEF